MIYYYAHSTKELSRYVKALELLGLTYTVDRQNERWEIVVNVAKEIAPPTEEQP